MSRKKILKQVESETVGVDDLIADILSYSVEEEEFFKKGNDYVIDGEVYRLEEVIEDDPIVLVFLSSTGKRIDVTPYSEVTVHEHP